MPKLNTVLHAQDRLVVIDFETCDTAATTQVLTLGATIFDPTVRSDINELQVNTFYAEFKEQQERTFSVDTIKFWTQQSRAAQMAAFEGVNKESASQVLVDFNEWLVSKKATHLIGNGASFDNPILSSLYKQYDIKPVLPFWCDLDLRTMRWLDSDSHLDWPKQLIQHHAAHDAIYEAARFQQIYANLNEGTN